MAAECSGPNKVLTGTRPAFPLRMPTACLTEECSRKGRFLTPNRAPPQPNPRTALARIESPQPESRALSLNRELSQPESRASQARASRSHGMSRSRFHRGVPARGVPTIGFLLSWPKVLGPASAGLPTAGPSASGFGGTGGAPRSVFPRGVKNTTCPFRSRQTRTPPS